MTRYIQNSTPPSIGTKATVHMDHKTVDTTVGEIHPESGLLLLFKGEPSEQYAGQAADLEWYLADSGHRVTFADDVLAGDEIHTLDQAAKQEIWQIIGSTASGDYIGRQVVEGTEYTRVFNHGIGGWVCVDDPEEFTGVTHKPVPQTPPLPADAPMAGDTTVRVVNGVSMLYRVRRIELREHYLVAVLSLVGHSEHHAQTVHVFRMDDNGWHWNDKKPVVFTSGSADVQALKATRLDTLHETLRNKYFHYAAMAEQTPPEFTTADAIRDEYAEMLFQVETGLRPDQVWDVDQFTEFYEGLHEEFLASIEE